MSSDTSSMTSMLAESARRFVARHYDFSRRNQRLVEDLGPASPLWREFGELGWLACLVPEEHGGLGGSGAEMAALMEVFGKALLVEPILSSAVLATRLIAASPDGALKARSLADLAQGGIQVAVAHAEDERAGPATAAAGLTGGRFEIVGRKSVVLGAPSASKVIVSAVVASGEGAALFCIDATAPGVDMLRYRTIDGHEAADISFRVTVEADALLADVDEGARVLAEALDWGAIAACAQLVGAIDEVIRICADYAKSRQQFGSPIGRFQSIKHLLSEMAVQALLARAMLARGVEALAETDAFKRERVVSATKNCIARAADFVTANGIQVHGGIGMTEEYIIGHYYKRALVLSEFFGSTQFHRRRFAARTADPSSSTLVFMQSGYHDAV